MLKADADNLPAITLGHAEDLQVGDVVLAIGNPFGFGNTVTSGIVSALGRNYLGLNRFEDFIQTDAAINPGNSGGALIDTAGNLIGINSTIFSQSGASNGIGVLDPGLAGAQRVRADHPRRRGNARLVRYRTRSRSPPDVAQAVGGLPGRRRADRGIQRGTPGGARGRPGPRRVPRGRRQARRTAYRNCWRASPNCRRDRTPTCGWCATASRSTST